MKIVLKKIEEVDFNELVTLNVIEKDADLTALFKEDNNLPFTLLYRLSKDNGLKPDIKETIFNIFDKVICTKKAYLNLYKQVLKGLDNQETPEPRNQETPAVVEKPALPKIDRNSVDLSAKIPVEKLKVEKSTDEKKLPKWYGKEKILKDIEAQGGKPTIKQTAALALNDYKNIYLSLNSRLISDMLLNTDKLTEDECRIIKSTIKIVENKLNPILKKR